MKIALALLAFSAAAQTPPIDTFQLPAKSIFSPAMPRYPNAWLYLDASLAPNYSSAVKRITSELRQAMRLPEFFPPFDNPEGCDYEVRIEHLQPWIERAHRPLQHAHAFHMRYYYSALEAANAPLVTVEWKGKPRKFYRLAASVHYEVGHANPNHADVEICPICGRTGQYVSIKGSLVEQVHDPLGLELLFTGKIRGEIVKAEDWEFRPVGSVQNLPALRATTFTYPGNEKDRNTLTIGVAVLEAR